MKIKISYKKHRLRFRFKAGTSRGILEERDAYFIKVKDANNPERQGIGEASPLRGLSPEFKNRFEEDINHILALEGNYDFPDGLNDDLPHYFTVLDSFPALMFALETALLDLYNGGKKCIFPGAFYQGQSQILINGLIWMGSPDFMVRQVEEKLLKGFSCIKMKIGAIDFEQELKILRSIRERFSKDEVTLRVDANGAFSPEGALAKLEALAKLDIHSIEQPIKAGQREEMALLCRESPVPIALDEELIGVRSENEKKEILEQIQPSFIILKPTLIGGLYESRNWIKLAREHQTGWWITSALESNVGLNAICQLADLYKPTIPQGLGTGGLYHNNIPSPLNLMGEYIYYDSQKVWEAIF